MKPGSSIELLKVRGDLPLEDVPCYLCGRKDGEVLVDDPPFKVLYCAGCGLGYTTPRVQGGKLKDLYDLGYFNSESAKDFGYTSYAGDAPGYLETFKKKVRIVQSVLPKGRILEVGCAAGFFLSAARDAGFEAHGIEVSKSIFAHARDVLKLDNLFLGTLADYPGARKSFDGVLMWDVIEHLADPGDNLVRARELLKDDGFLFLQTQDLESMFRKVAGSRWTHFKQLEHIYHFSRKTLTRLLDKCGYEVV